MTEESLFLAALERADLDERRAFLRQACGDDDALYQRVEQLLAAYAAGQGKLEPPTGPAEKAGEGALLATVDHGAAAAGAVVAGRYRLLERIGEGGMGEVWVAKQTEPVQRKVALKLIRADRDSRQVVARFEAERQALALMDHPNIARVLDGGETENGRPFFVMELVNGLPLTRFCDEAKLTPRERLELFIPICQAIQHAHQKGIIHRDLKPANVLVTLYDGKPVPKVIDFGVAKAIGGRLIDESLATQFGAVIGTFEYMAPEQAGFSALDVDTRSDVYSLGVILYEVLTGLRPFDSTRLRKAALDEMVRILREEEPPKPSTRLSTDGSAPTLAALRQTDPKRLAALMRGELDWVVMKCLEKDRNRRYDTANGLALDLRRYLTDEPVQAGPPSASYRLRKFVRRNRGPVLAAAMMALLLVGGAAVSAWQAWRATVAEGVAESRREVAAEAEKQAKEDRDEADKQRNRAEHSLYVANMNRVRFEVEHNNVARARELLDLYRNPAGPAKDRRGWEWFYWDRICQGELYTVAAHRGTVSNVAFSPDGSLIASCGSATDPTVKLWDTVAGKPWRAPLAHPRVRTVAFSPDGRSLASCGDEVKLWDLGSGTEQKILRPEGKSRFYYVAYSPDGKTLAVAETPSMRIRFWDLEDERWAGSLPGLTSRDVLCYSPDGKVLAVGRQDGAQLWDVARQSLLRTVGGHVFIPGGDATFTSEAITALAFSPDSKTLATASRDGTARFHDVGNGKTIRSLTVLPAEGFPAASLAALSFSPDGRYLFTAGSLGTLKGWEVSTGRETSAFVGHTAGIKCLAISPDGVRLVSGDEAGGLKLWDATTGPAQLPSLGPVINTSTPTFSPDGKRLALRFVGKTVGGRVEVRHLAQASRMTILDHKPHEVNALAFSPDSKLLAVSCLLLDRKTLKLHSHEIRLWDLGSGKVVRTISGIKSEVVQLAFSPDGTALALATRSTPAPGRESLREIELWDVKGERRYSLRGTSLAFSPVGRALAVVTGENTLELIDWGRQQELASFPVHASSGRVSFSQDGKRLAFDGTVWDVASGEVICRLKGADSSTVLSPDGARLFSIAPRSVNSGLLRVWDATSGDLVLAVPVPGRQLAVHPDGWRCAVASSHGGICLVDARPLTPELREEQLAHGIVAYLFLREVLKEDVVPALRRIRTISEPVRRKAMELTLQLENDVLLLNKASGGVIVAADKTTREYQQALRWAQEMARLAPEEGAMVENLGGALYRLGRYKEAVAAIERAEELSRKAGSTSPFPMNTLFLAMAEQKMGLHESARARFRALRQGGIRSDVWREAEALIEGKKD